MAGLSDTPFANDHAAAVPEAAGLMDALLTTGWVSGERIVMGVTLRPKLQRGELIRLC